MQVVWYDDYLRKEYSLLGAKRFAKKYNINPSTITSRASKLGIVFKNYKSDIFCLFCNKKIGKYDTRKKDLCRNCSAKEVYKKRGSFTHKNGNLWTNEEILLLKKEYYGLDKKELCKKFNRGWSSITHKVNRLGLKRNPKFMEEGNKKGREWFKENNPMKNPIYKEKARKSLNELYRKNPDKLLNARLRRNQMTKIEKVVSIILDRNKINYKWNKYVRTKKTWRFPDFMIGNLIIECDGLYWHEGNEDKDLERQKELEEIGYKVIRFSDIEILNQEEFVERCILQELKK